jgi:hypothetical protein
MKLLMMVFAFLICCTSFAEELQYNCSDQPDVLTLSKDQVAQRGCCSHHGGVCGCDNHSVVCCDNSHSPTCGCHASDVKGFLESHEAEIPKS